MEYIFEDDVGELGSEVEAYCQKCRTEGPHTVITRYEDEVRQVQCGTCGHVHVFKPARPEAAEEEAVEPTPVGGVKGRRPQKKLTWEEAMRHPASNKAKVYGFRDPYRQGDYLDHPKFGKGYVNDVIDDTKIEAVFKDGQRMLVHNRKDLGGKGATPQPAKPAAKPAKPAKASKPAKPAQPAIAAKPAAAKLAARDRRHAAHKAARSASPKRRTAKPRAHPKPKAKAKAKAKRPSARAHRARR